MTPLKLMSDIKPLEKLNPVAKNGLAAAAAMTIPVINLNELGKEPTYGSQDYKEPTLI